MIYYAGKKYDVKYTTSVDKSEDNWGYVDFAKDEILIYTKGIKEICIAETLLHEACHIVLEYAGLGISSDMFEPTNEYLTAMMATGFTQLYILNPDLTKYLNQVFYN